jgi:hypothetical protein
MSCINWILKGVLDWDTRAFVLGVATFVDNMLLLLGPSLLTLSLILFFLEQRHAFEYILFLPFGE